MTQLSKERLEEIAELARKANYKPCAVHMTNLIAVCDSEVIEEMARRLLAVEGQEPVAWEVKGILCHTLDEANRYVGQPEPLYAAPPAPVAQPVQVPEPITRNDADGWWMYKGRRVGGGCAEWYNRALEDCRAAMLKAEPVSQPYKLPDGWKLVPVEPTLAMLTVLDFTGSFESMKQRYEAMLAAAPQEPIK